MSPDIMDLSYVPQYDNPWNTDYDHLEFDDRTVESLCQEIDDYLRATLDGIKRLERLIQELNNTAVPQQKRLILRDLEELERHRDAIKAIQTRLNY
jgi:uncharacterized protein Yka (UPF0111/DUF47 family)